MLVYDLGGGTFDASLVHMSGLANEVVAGHMSRAKAPMIYRIHENPDPDALGHVAQILKEFDYPVKDVHGASPATFQRIIAFAHARPEKRLINSLLLRALERARYVDYLGTHFGLASESRPLTRFAYRSASASIQPVRRGRPVVAPNSLPIFRICSPRASFSSVG